MTRIAPEPNRTPDVRSVSKRRQTLLDIAAFALSLIPAFIFHWRADDLAWSLWSSSLALGCAVYLCWIIPAAWHDIPSWRSAMPLHKRVIAPFGTLVRLVLPLTVLFVLFYVGAHLLYSVFLNFSLPVIDGRREPGWAMYHVIFRDYWLFLPIAFFREHRAFLSLFRKNKSDKGAQTSFWHERAKTLLKTHILIFVLAFLPLGGSGDFLPYVAVSAVYFFPWELIMKTDSKRNWQDIYAKAKARTDERLRQEQPARERPRKKRKR